MDISETNDETREYHYKGKKQGEGFNYIRIREYQSCGEKNDCCTDEFLNDYIPHDFGTFVTWKDVLACGMIPEQRTNPHIREDIQFQNIPIELPEAPSPAPAPDPSKHSVIQAEPIHPQYTIECEYHSDKIDLKIRKNCDKINFIRIIDSKDDFWKEISKYFQNDFKKFHELLDLSLKDQCDQIQSEIKHTDQTQLMISLRHEGMLSFHINIILEKEQDRIDIMEQQIKSLKQEVKVLKNVCGLDRRLKITKIEEEDYHKYYQYDLKKYIDGQRYHQNPQEYDFGIINKTDFILEPSPKEYDRKIHHLRSSRFPRNTCMLFSIKITLQNHPASGSWTDGGCKATFGLGSNQCIIGGPEDSLLPGWNQFDSRRMGDLDEYYVMNITFPKLPDFMKIDNVNTLDIDIYKMKGIYIITYE